MSCRSIAAALLIVIVAAGPAATVRGQAATAPATAPAPAPAAAPTAPAPAPAPRPAAPASAPAASAAGPRVELIDGQTLSGSVESIQDAKVAVATASGKKEVALADVAEIVLQAAPAAVPAEQAGKIVVFTAANEPLTAGRISVADGKLEIVSPVLGTLRLDLTGVSLIAMPPAGRTAADVRRKLADVKAENEKIDLLLVGENLDQAMPVSAVLKSIDGEFVTVDWQGEDQRIARKKVVAIALAGSVRPAQPAGTLLAVDGSTLAFVSVALSGAQFAVDSPSAGKVAIARGGVAAIRLASDKVANLMDLKPASVREHGFLDKAFPHRMNRSAGGKPLTLDGKLYPTGLGLHSFCELTYDLGGAYTRLVCTAGIDDAVRPQGDAVLTFLADGKSVGESVRLTGKDKARTLSVDIASAKSLTIRVDFGPDQIDVADHVNLVGVRLIK